MERGYPPGTKCVVTWALRIEYIGTIVEVMDAFVFPASVTGHPAQNIVFVDDPETVWNQPIDWMRPIDKDTDEDDQEVIRQMNTIRVRDRVTKLDPAWGEGVER